jgi:hypothetical protein
MKYYFEYSVSVYDPDYQKEVKYYGITYSETYNEALSCITSFYGEKDINSVTLEAWDSEGCLMLSKEALAELKEAL